MQKKIDYVQGFCHTMHYNGLWAMQVIRENENELYHKDKMICDAILTGRCKDDKCSVFQNANDIVEEDKEWRLKDKKLE